MLIYFTTQQRVSKAEANHWLPGRFGDSFVKRETSSGVDGASGNVFCRDDRFCRHDKDTQEWHSLGKFPRTPGSDETVELWVGWEKSKPPVPADLIRPDALPGHTVMLAGNPWMIPMVREWELGNGGSVIYNTTLPRPAKYDAEQKIWHAGEVVERYQRLFDHAEEIYELYSTPNEDDTGFDLPKNPLDICAEFLAANYFIGPEEVSVLRLIEFNFSSAWSVLRLAIDDPGIGEIVQKKRESEAS